MVNQRWRKYITTILGNTVNWKLIFFTMQPQMSYSSVYNYPPPPPPSDPHWSHCGSEPDRAMCPNVASDPGFASKWKKKIYIFCLTFSNKFFVVLDFLPISCRPDPDLDLYCQCGSGSGRRKISSDPDPEHWNMQLMSPRSSKSFSFSIFR